MNIYMYHKAAEREKMAEFRNVTISVGGLRGFVNDTVYTIKVMKKGLVTFKKGKVCDMVISGGHVEAPSASVSLYFAACRCV